MTGPRWVCWWFRGAAIYGVVALLPGYWSAPPGAAALSHYGFVGTALAFQAVFWLIAADPPRYRALMLAAVAEKLAFGVPAIMLAADGTAAPIAGLFGAIDLILGAGFLLAWRSTARN